MKKKDKKISVTTIILIILVLGLSGYIIYDKVILKQDSDSENTKNESQEQKEEFFDVSYNEVMELYSLVDVFNDSFFDEPYYAYLYRQDKLLASDIPNEIKIIMAMENAMKDRDVSPNELEDSGIKYDIPADLVDKYIKKIFGNTDYEKESIKKSYVICGASPVEYDLKNNLFSVTYYGCSPNSYQEPQLYTRVTKAEKNNSELNIYVKVLFSSINIDDNENSENNCLDYSEYYGCMKDVSLYKDIKKTELIGVMTEKINFDDYLYYGTEEIYNKYKDQMAIYKLNFVKENDNYRFVKIEKQ